MGDLEFDLRVDEQNASVRIDQYLHRYFTAPEKEDEEGFPAFSRSRLQKFIKEQNVLVNRIPVKQNYIVRPHDVIHVRIPEQGDNEVIADPEEMDLEIVYSDPDLVLINKPEGLVVHPAAGHSRHTLVNGLLHLFPELKQNTRLYRMGIVHRLDKDTSGLILVTKNERTQQSIMVQFRDRTIKKEYTAIVEGLIKEKQGEINLPIGRSPRDRKKMAVRKEGGREALTRYSVIRYLSNCTFVRLVPHTGRTHQLRVHMQYIKHPVIGDEIYSSLKKGSPGLMLCARKIRFYHPGLKKEMEFEIELPGRFLEILNKGEY